MEGNPYIDRFEVDSQETVSADHNPYIQMDAGVAFTLAANNQQSLAWGYGHMLGVEIDSLKYDYQVTPEEEEWALATLGGYRGQAKKVALVARHSASCTSNDPRVRVANKCVVNRLWVQTANWLLRQRILPIAVGSAKDAEDNRYADWPGERLYGAPIRRIAGLCRHADFVLTVDNGVRHLTAAAGGNLYCISGRIPLWLINCQPVREGQKIYEDYRELPMVTAQTLIEGAQKML